MNKLVFSTEKTINSKPIQVIERKRNDMHKAVLISHTVIIRDGKTNIIMHNNIPTGLERPGHKYAKDYRDSYLKTKDTLNALKQINDLFLN